MTFTTETRWCKKCEELLWVVAPHATVGPSGFRSLISKRDNICPPSQRVFKVQITMFMKSALLNYRLLYINYGAILFDDSLDTATP